MNSTTSNTNELDQLVFDALDACIMKIADTLKKKFNPEEKESKSLFRLFCSSLKTRIMIMKKNPGAIVKTNQSLNKSSDVQNMLNTGATIFKDIESNNTNSTCSTDKNKKKSRLNQFLRNRKLA